MNSQILTDTSDTSQAITLEERPYPPSYLDRFMAAVNQLPIPYWLTYLALFMLQVMVFHVVAWLDGWVPPFTFEPLNVSFPLWTWAPLAIMTYLDSIALWALSSFSPLMNVQDETIRRLEYEFTTMPARSVIISGVIWSIIYVIFTIQAFHTLYVAFELGTLARVHAVTMGLIAFFVGSTIYYHSIRQLRLVSRTVKKVKRFNMFRLDPVYAFSRLTAHTGVAWVIFISLALLIYPIELTPLPFLATLFLQVLLALAAFMLPLWNVHQRLVWEKRGLLAELNQRVEATLERLHRCLDEDELGEMGQINSALAGLAAERQVLIKIPTWPWRARTLTGFLSAILLPLVLFLIRLAIENGLIR